MSYLNKTLKTNFHMTILKYINATSDRLMKSVKVCDMPLTGVMWSTVSSVGRASDS